MRSAVATCDHEFDDEHRSRKRVLLWEGHGWRCEMPNLRLDTVLTEPPGVRPMIAQHDSQAVVFIVDDDASVREAMQRLFRSVGLRAEVFASASEFLRSKPADVPSCLVLDVRLPDLHGLDCQTELTKADIHVPIV